MIDAQAKIVAMISWWGFQSRPLETREESALLVLPKAVLLSITLLLAACANQTYKSTDYPVRASIVQGNLEPVLDVLDASVKTKNVLYNLDKGELLLAQGSFEKALPYFENASKESWDQFMLISNQSNPDKVGSYLLADNMFDSNYYLKDYERTEVSQRLVLIYLTLGKKEKAQVEARRIMAYEQYSQGLYEKLDFSEYDNYVSQFVNSGVLPGKKLSAAGYQNASAHYLVSMAMADDKNQANIALAKATALAPSIQKLKGDTTILIDQSLLVKEGMVSTSLSFPGAMIAVNIPLLQPREPVYKIAVAINNKSIACTRLSNLDLFAETDMNIRARAYFLKEITRNLVSVGLQQGVMAQGGRHGLASAMVAGILMGSIAGKDSRKWSVLPSETWICKANTSNKPFELEISNGAGSSLKKMVQGSLVYSRVFGNRVSIRGQM